MAIEESLSYRECNRVQITGGKRVSKQISSSVLIQCVFLEVMKIHPQRGQEEVDVIEIDVRAGNGSGCGFMI